jgi:hypothetical protein
VVICLHGLCLYVALFTAVPNNSCIRSCSHRTKDDTGLWVGGWVGGFVMKNL